MRRERTMQLILNSKLHQHTRPIQREATVIFAGTSLAGEPRTFLIKVNTCECVGNTTCPFIILICGNE
jgi:hypothetical protein